MIAVLPVPFAPVMIMFLCVPVVKRHEIWLRKLVKIKRLIMLHRLRIFQPFCKVLLYAQLKRDSLQGLNRHVTWFVMAGKYHPRKISFFVGPVVRHRVIFCHSGLGPEPYCGSEAAMTKVLVKSDTVLWFGYSNHANPHVCFYQNNML